MVGRGRFPTLLSSLLEADSSSIAHHVRAVAMSTSEGRNVSWTFREDAGESASICFIKTNFKEMKKKISFCLVSNLEKRLSGMQGSLHYSY